jgi:microcystin-dependent protein
MKAMKTFTAAAVLLAASTLVATAQVGINTVTPDTSALLDIRYTGAGHAVGVLLPDLNASERASKKSAVSKGMLVFDRTEGQLYYHDGSEWVAANPLVSVHENNGFTDIRPQNTGVNQQNMSLGLPPSEPATAKLDVNGSTRVRQDLQVDKNLQVDDNLQVGGRGSFAANVRVAGTDSVNRLVANSSVVNGNSEVTGTLTAGTLAGNGTIPVGGIIMWSGTTPPTGWALCTGQTVNNHTTPNLQGRFIVGYNSSDTDYDNIGKTGGEKEHTLTIDEMPSHNHIYSYTPYSPYETSNDHDTDHRALASENRATSYTGGSQPHENRPPYYVLAFIMRVQ